MGSLATLRVPRPREQVEREAGGPSAALASPPPQSDPPEPPPRVTGLARPRARFNGVAASAGLHLLALLVLLLVGPEVRFILPTSSERPTPSVLILPLGESRLPEASIPVVPLAAPATPEPRAAAPPAASAPAAPPVAPSDATPGAGQPLPAEPGVGAGSPGISPSPSAPGGVPRGERTAAEQLRPPATADPRLWRLPPEAVGLTPAQAAELRLVWAILDGNDSIAVLNELAERAKNWTFTDDDGGKWGVSSDGIHLGSLTIPIPFAINFGGPPAEVMRRRPGAIDAQRAWIDAEIRKYAASVEVRQTVNQRIKAIRERIDQQRRPPAPDTLRRR